MHEIAPLIKDLAIILGVAGLIALLFQKIKQPIVLGYLIAGLIIGPYTPPFKLVSDVPNIQILSELGVIFLMFSLGLEFSFHKLKRVGLSATVTGFVEVVFMVLIGFIVGELMSWSFHDSLFLGAAISISSTTIIIKTLEELKLKRKRFSEIIFGVLVVEDLLAILLLVGLSTVVATNNIFSAEMGWAALRLILVVGSWFIFGYFLIPSLFQRIRYYASEETLIIVSIALCLILVCVAAHFHYSPALGAFIMGSIIAETPLVHRIEHLVQPVRNIFAAVFFVSVGMLIDPLIIINHFSIIMIVCFVTIFGKLIVTGFGALLTGQNVSNSTRIGFSMAQIGEFSFIIAGLGLSLKATSHMLYPIIVAVSTITTFTTPYLIRLSGYLGPKLEKSLPTPIHYMLSSYTGWLYQISANRKGQSLYGKAALRLAINGLIVIVIFNTTVDWVLPKLIEAVGHAWLGKLLTWLLTLVITSPFIWGMLVSFSKTRPTSSKQILRNTPAPYLLSWLATLLEIVVLSLTFFDTWLVFILILLIGAGIFSLGYKQLDKFYHWFEKRLADNLQQNAKGQAQYEELAPWDTHLIEVEVPRQSPLANQSLTKYQLRQRFGINIVGIYRGSDAILSPRGEQIIMPFDKLIVLGNDEQLERFIEEYFQANEEASLHDVLANFTLKAILVKDHSPWIGQSIAHSGIREQAKGLVVGIERQGTRILNPDSAEILKAGDLLLIVGETHHLQAM
jgi:CPA2 family monovalent cation:H+ antiporter-2